MEIVADTVPELTMSLEIGLALDLVNRCDQNNIRALRLKFRPLRPATVWIQRLREIRPVLNHQSGKLSFLLGIFITDILIVMKFEL